MSVCHPIRSSVVLFPAKWGWDCSRPGGLGVLVGRNWVITAAHNLSDGNQDWYVTGYDRNCALKTMVEEIHWRSGNRHSRLEAWPTMAGNLAGDCELDELVLLKLAEDLVEKNNEYAPAFFGPMEDDDGETRLSAASHCRATTVRQVSLTSVCRTPTRLFAYATNKVDSASVSGLFGKDSGGGWFSGPHSKVLVGITQARIDASDSDEPPAFVAIRIRPDDLNWFHSVNR